MKWRLLGLVLFALGLYAAWRTSIDMRDQTRRDNSSAGLGIAVRN